MTTKQDKSMALPRLKKLSHMLACALTLASPATAATFTADFYPNFGSSAQSQQDMAPILRNFVSPVFPFGQSSSATIRSSLTSLGLELRANRLTPSARATAFTEVNFATTNPGAVTAIGATSLSFLATGTWTGDIAVSTAFGALLPGTPTTGTQADIRVFTDSTDAFTFGAGDLLMTQRVTGSFNRSYDFSSRSASAPVFKYSEPVYCASRPGVPPTSEACIRARAASSWCSGRGGCTRLSPMVSTGRFGFGLAFDAQIAEEVLLTGNISSLNSFNFEGLVAFDSTTGERVDGVFYTDEGISLTRGVGFGEMIPFSPDVAPVPLPATGWMLIASVGGLVTLRRRRHRTA